MESMSNLIALLAAALALIALPPNVLVPLFAVGILIVEWCAIEREGASRSRATHEAVVRSRTVLGALES